MVGIDDLRPNGVSPYGLSAAKSLKRKITTIGDNHLVCPVRIWKAALGVERGAIRFCFC